MTQSKVIYRTEGSVQVIDFFSINHTYKQGRRVNLKMEGAVGASKEDSGGSLCPRGGEGLKISLTAWAPKRVCYDGYIKRGLR
jgi:hypothetical protein